MNQDVKETKEERVVNETNLINRRWFELIDGKWTLVVRKCKNCGSTYLFQKVTCPNCLQESQFEVVPLSGKGKLYTYTIGRAMQPGIRTPVAMGDVDLLEGPRVFAFLDVSEPYEAKLRIGMDVKMVIGEIRKDEKGNSLYCYMFRPI